MIKSEPIFNFSKQKVKFPKIQIYLKYPIFPKRNQNQNQNQNQFLEETDLLTILIQLEIFCEEKSIFDQKFKLSEKEKIEQKQCLLKIEGLKKQLESKIQTSTSKWMKKKKLEFLFPNLATYVSNKIFTSNSYDLEEYLSQMSLLNQIFMLCIDLKENLLLKNHSFIPKKISLLFSLLNESGGFKKEKEMIQKEFHLIKSLIQNSAENSFTIMNSAYSKWVQDLCDQIIENISKFPKEVIRYSDKMINFFSEI
ncbi:hypothetical protein M0811_13507 [Anaeramoeba ignava]|uniref:Uncharacterized protein n=1 Tax=Anaeramoeba ignava TaxID=1746090 RepID=A0A9Q0L706_ANAIG|nr:hypothetical protein M0811_13507 [Anaeramoeba ignava]